jgi:hypothetical protein
MDVQSASELVNVRAAAKASVEAVMAGIHAIKQGSCSAVWKPLSKTPAGERARTAHRSGRGQWQV